MNMESLIYRCTHRRFAPEEQEYRIVYYRLEISAGLLARSKEYSESSMGHPTCGRLLTVKSTRPEVHPGG